MTVQHADIAQHEARSRDLATAFIRFLETGEPADGLFSPDVLCDFTMPLWRLQAQGISDVVTLREHGHPGPGRVPRSRFDATGTWLRRDQPDRTAGSGAAGPLAGRATERAGERAGERTGALGRRS
ncbi:MAG TPA: hypothetical protein VFU36_16995 [Jatrophihabitans sp.]|nr:hypothetical protein [Jatrophihabitans sp.]